MEQYAIDERSNHAYMHIHIVSWLLCYNSTYFPVFLFLDTPTRPPVGSMAKSPRCTQPTNGWLHQTIPGTSARAKRQDPGIIKIRAGHAGKNMVATNNGILVNLCLPAWYLLYYLVCAKCMCFPWALLAEGSCGMYVGLYVALLHFLLTCPSVSPSICPLSIPLNLPISDGADTSTFFSLQFSNKWTPSHLYIFGLIKMHVVPLGFVNRSYLH